jgi:integrase
LPLALFMCTGLRKLDIFTATMADIRDGDINVVTSKRDTPVAIPLHDYVIEALAQRPGPAIGKIVVRKNGKPYTADGFDTIWHRFRTRLEAEGKVGKGLTLHGLRHTLGTMLKEAGLSDGAIADVLAQASVSMARHYSRNARLPDETRAKIVAIDMGKR